MPAPAEPPESTYLILVSGPDRAAMVELGRRVVTERLAACANVWTGVHSVFRWRGEVQEEEEVLVFLKSTAGNLSALGARVRELHPYEEPEFLAFAVDEGSPSFLAWVAESVRARRGEDGGS
ncbi:MAG: divalent-cation tolerance protein CutA [Gemmatimonadota bacterium]